MMFSNLDTLPVDPILGLIGEFRNDPRTEKIDLGVGVFKTPDGQTPVMRAVKEAEAAIIKHQDTKTYSPPDGAPGFNDGILKLVFGEGHEALAAGRCASVETPGGCGALRVAGELLVRAGAKNVAIGTPTWPNHKPLLSEAGLEIKMLPYFDAENSQLEFTAFLDAVKKLGPEDVLLLHGPCHNPTGADLSRDEIDQVYDVALDRKFLVMVDSAYHGFAQNLEDDAYVMREAARRLPEAMITYSCSKNFGLYRERTGAAIMVGADSNRASAMKSHALSIARSMYSMPPAHGGQIVSEILQSPDLCKHWQVELGEMAQSIRTNRKLLADAATDAGLGNRLGFITSQNGMFSLLPMNEALVKEIKEKHGVYMVGAGRISLCGVNADNAKYLASALKDVMGA